MTFNDWIRVVNLDDLGFERDFVADCRLDKKMPVIKNKKEFDTYFSRFLPNPNLENSMDIVWRKYSDSLIY